MVDANESSAKMSAFLLRTVIDVALSLQLAGAVAYWWLSPKGFPIDSSRFWLNSVLPLIVVAVALVGLIAMHRRRWSSAATVILCFAWAWCAGAIFGRILFPVSLRIVWLLPLFVSAVGIACYYWLKSGEPRWNRGRLLGAFILAFVGWFAIWAQVPPVPSTTPLSIETPESETLQSNGSITSALKLGSNYEFNTASAELTVTRGDIRITCSPVLEFDRISPDRFWSLLAPAMDERLYPTAETKGTMGYAIHYNNGAVVMLSAPTPDNSIRIIAHTPVRQDTFSHLNTFCYFEVYGHRKLSLSFSPCPDDEVQVLPSDYPTGRPARVAYVDDVGEFRVVEATSGEKGPFRKLAAGELARGKPLTIELQDESRPVASITLDDWSSQVSTVLSPTAGWGLPTNAIEFQRLGDAPSSPVGIWVSLAVTSVGRGWETVGHRAGTYRNSLTFRIFPPGGERN